MHSLRCSLLCSTRPFRGQSVRRWAKQGPRSLVSASSMQFGQPLHETHPHLLSPGELTPGITALEYAERRARLAASLPRSSIAILAASDLKYRSGAVFYKFHQDPNFLYLTGFNEPDAIAVIEKDGSGAQHNFHLYCRPKDPKIEKWDGSRSGIQAAQDVFNADETGDVGNVVTLLSQVVASGRDIYSDIPVESMTVPTFTKIVFGTATPAAGSIGELLQKTNVRPLRPFMNELRVTKSPAEIACMATAGAASGAVFTEAVGTQFQTERELETFMDYGFRSTGCEESAYVPVIAGGQIHYVSNDNVLRDGDLVTVDAGGEYGGYVTDITRAWPVGRQFTPAQRDLYEMVLGVQRKCVELCRENADLSLDGLHDVAEAGLGDGLRRLGFNLSNNGLSALFPHHVGHYLGLAVHDAPGHSRTVKLKRNMTITIEPGIYVDDDERWPKHFRGLGLRIEDSVCVGEKAAYVMSQGAVKEIAEIEALREKS